MKSAKLLREKLSRDDLVTGLLVTLHLWPDLVEIAKRGGADYIIIDREHGAHSDELTAEVCALGRYLDVAVLIRPIDSDYSTIRKAIDLGPCGLLLPTVEGASQLDVVRDSIYMPPRGKRRPGGAGNRWVGSIDYRTWRSEVEDDFIILPQIESTEGLSRVDEIAAHEITTAIAIGPYDLSMDLGVGGEMDHPRLLEAEATIRDAGKRASKKMWVIGDPVSLVARGHTFLCVGEPSVLLQNAIQLARESSRNEAGKSGRLSGEAANL